VSSGGLGLSVWSRALEEHRRLVYPLVVLLIVNVIVFAFVVYPLSQQVANVEERNQAAERELVGARAEHARAAGTLGGKVRATQELGTFYGTVLPSDFAGARRLTHLRVPQMARKASLRYESASVSQDQERGSSLTRFETEVSLTGRWADIRGFLHNLEADPGFVVIDNVQLTEGDAGSGDASIQVTLHLSTYYRTGAAQ
jgi:Tfp pilus assembly protein PilO